MILFHLYIRPKKSVKASDVEVVLSHAVDWLRYDPNLFLVLANDEDKDLQNWRKRLMPLCEGDGLETNGRMLIWEVCPYRYDGFLPKNAWTWFRNASKRVNDSE